MMSVLGGIGSVLGGLSGFFGKDSAPSQGRQIYSQVQGAVTAGKEFNLHPLAVLGNTSSYAPAPANNVQDGLASMGNALQNMGQMKADKAAAAKANELMDAQIAEARSRTLLNLGNANRAMVGPSAPTGATGGLEQIVGGAGTTYSPHVTHNQSKRPMAVEPERDYPVTSRVGVGDKSVWVPNPEAFEVGLSELIAGAMVMGPQLLWQHYDDWYDKQKTNPTRYRSSETTQRPEYGPSRYK